VFKRFLSRNFGKKRNLGEKSKKKRLKHIIWKKIKKSLTKLNVKKSYKKAKN